MDVWNEISQFFLVREFDSPDQEGSAISGMNDNFLRKLFHIRKDANFPFIINSGYRTKEHNLAVGGVTFSAHTKGLAADIRTVGNHQRWCLIDSAMKHGIARIGIAKTYVHLDIDDSLPSPRIWLYG